jgi:hypothetical protein
MCPQIEKGKRWRNEDSVQSALDEVRGRSEAALDEAIVAALEAGATFKEVASAAGFKSTSTVYRRAVNHRAAAA